MTDAAPKSLAEVVHTLDNLCVLLEDEVYHRTTSVGMCRELIAACEERICALAARVSERPAGGDGSTTHPSTEQDERKSLERSSSGGSAEPSALPRPPAGGGAAQDGAAATPVQPASDELKKQLEAVRGDNEEMKTEIDLLRGDFVALADRVAADSARLRAIQETVASLAANARVSAALAFLDAVNDRIPTVRSEVADSPYESGLSNTKKEALMLSMRLTDGSGATQLVDAIVPFLMRVREFIKANDSMLPFQLAMYIDSGMQARLRAYAASSGIPEPLTTHQWYELLNHVVDMEGPEVRQVVGRNGRNTVKDASSLAAAAHWSVIPEYAPVGASSTSLDAERAWAGVRLVMDRTLETISYCRKTPREAEDARERFLIGVMSRLPVPLYGVLLQRSEISGTNSVAPLLTPAAFEHVLKSAINDLFADSDAAASSAFSTPVTLISELKPLLRDPRSVPSSSAGSARPKRQPEPEPSCVATPLSVPAASAPTLTPTAKAALKQETLRAPAITQNKTTPGPAFRAPAVASSTKFTPGSPHRTAARETPIAPNEHFGGKRAAHAPLDARTTSPSVPYRVPAGDSRAAAHGSRASQRGPGGPGPAYRPANDDAVPAPGLPYRAPRNVVGETGHQRRGTSVGKHVGLQREASEALRAHDAAANATPKGGDNGDGVHATSASPHEAPAAVHVVVQAVVGDAALRPETLASSPSSRQPTADDAPMPTERHLPASNGIPQGSSDAASNSESAPSGLRSDSSASALLAETALQQPSAPTPSPSAAATADMHPASSSATAASKDRKPLPAPTRPAAYKHGAGKVATGAATGAPTAISSADDTTPPACHRCHFIHTGACPQFCKYRTIKKCRAGSTVNSSIPRSHAQFVFVLTRDWPPQHDVNIRRFAQPGGHDASPMPLVGAFLRQMHTR